MSYTILLLSATWMTGAADAPAEPVAAPVVVANGGCCEQSCCQPRHRCCLFGLFHKRCGRSCCETSCQPVCQPVCQPACPEPCCRKKCNLFSCLAPKCCAPKCCAPKCEPVCEPVKCCKPISCCESSCGHKCCGHYGIISRLKDWCHSHRSCRNDCCDTGYQSYPAAPAETIKKLPDPGEKEETEEKADKSFELGDTN